MLCLGIISWKGAFRFNRGVVFFQMGGGFIFKWEGAPHGGASVLMGEVFEKNHRMGGAPSMPSPHPTMGNPALTPK